MEVEHSLPGEDAFVHGVYDVVGRVVAAGEEIGVGDGIVFGGFVADVVEMAVPPATGVGDVKEFVEVDIEIGFGEDAQFFIIIFFPDIPVIEF